LQLFPQEENRMHRITSRKVVLCGFTVLVAAMLLCAAPQESAKKSAAGTRTLSLEELEDKVRGAWAGQMIGVTYGGPTEFRFRGKINDQPREWKPEELRDALNQDDLYVDMTFAQAMDRLGVDATIEQFGEAFRNTKYSLWHANLAARRLLRRGIKPPLTGHPDYNFHANDIDFQIESDFVGIMCPGLPRAAQRYAERVGHVMNYGDGVYGGVFVSAMYSAAFFEKDPRKVVEAGLAAIPAASIYAQMISDVLKWSAENEDWKKTWQLLEEKWDRDDPCPDGALRPFNIDASLNGAYIVLGLLYGRGDFEKTMEVSMRAGQDSDCNPSSAAGILGTILGYHGIPAKWTAPLADIADEKFAYTDYYFNTIVRSSIQRAKVVVKLEGGQVTEKSLIIPVQKPLSLKLEQFQPGKIVERIGISDPRWKWEGEWEKDQTRRERMRAQAKGTAATVSFKGTGAMLVGTLRPEGGTATVYLDGKPIRTVDCFNDDGVRGSEGLWGRFNLSPGEHTLRVVVNGELFPGSKGTWIDLEDLIVFQK